jgi:hypothetical protein
LREPNIKKQLTHNKDFRAGSNIRVCLGYVHANLRSLNDVTKNEEASCAYF